MYDTSRMGWRCAKRSKGTRDHFRGSDQFQPSLDWLKANSFSSVCPVGHWKCLSHHWGSFTYSLCSRTHASLFWLFAFVFLSATSIVLIWGQSVRGPCFLHSSSVSPSSSTCRCLVRGVAHGCPSQRLGFQVFSWLLYLHHPPIFTGDLEVLPSLY